MHQLKVGSETGTSDILRAPPARALQFQPSPPTPKPTSIFRVALASPRNGSRPASLVHGTAQGPGRNMCTTVCYKTRFARQEASSRQVRAAHRGRGKAQSPLRHLVTNTAQQCATVPTMVDDTLVLVGAGTKVSAIRSCNSDGSQPLVWSTYYFSPSIKA